MEALLRELEAANELSGVVAIVQSDHELLHRAYGYASRTWAVPATVETRFSTASITKLFTAVAVLQLVERGAFGLHDSVVGYLGLEGTGMLGLMVERASGTSYRSYVEERVLAPAGMFPPVGGPDSGAHVTAGDLLRFHDAVRGRRLGPGPTAELLSPKERHGARGAGSHMMGFGFEFETDRAGEVVCYWKEGVNVGVSGILRHYPAQEVTVAVLAVGETAAWGPVRAIDEAVRSA